MSKLTGWLYTVRSLVRRNEADREMEDEIAFHIERQTRKNETLGIPAAEARVLALREFGGTTRWREEARRARGSTPVDVIERDVRQAIRSLRRNPAFVTMATLTLALAIGANAAMFGIVDRLLLRGPEHLAAPEQVVRVYVTRVLPNANVTTSGLQPYVLYRGVRDHTSAFSAVATYLPMDVRVGVGLESRLVHATYATPDLFALAKIRPALGRFYAAAEDLPPRGEPVVVLGYGYWRSDLAGDSSIVGKVVTLDDRRFRVVGVAPRGFTGVERAPIAAWLPMSTRPVDPRARDWATSWRPSTPGIVVGRLAVSKAQATAQLTSMVRREYEGPDKAMRTATVRVLPISYDLQGAEPRELGVARLLAGVALVMLLVAAANMTNLTLARALSRRRELGVRVALGAGRWTLVRLMIVETVLISLLGGMLGLALARWGGALVREALLPNVAWNELPVNGRVLALTIAATLVTGVIVGLIPALRVSGGDVAGALRAGRSDSAGAGESHGTARASLQVVQLALSLVLLFTAGLFVRSLRDIQHLDLGYDRDRVLAVDISFARPDSGATAGVDASAVAARTRYEDLRAQFERVPGVASASIAFSSPLSAVNITKLRVPGLDSLPSAKGGIALLVAAAPDYFETVGTRILRGRGFEDSDGSSAEPVVVVNETMARTLWPGTDAIGRCVVLGVANPDACARVVGIAADVHHMTLKEDALNQGYVPWGQNPRFLEGSVVLVRGQPDAGALIPALTNVVRHSALHVRSLQIRSFEELLDPQVRPWRVGALLFGLFGTIVVVVAAIGLFSVVSYLVTQRTHELGVRIALGAQRGQVLRLIMGGALRTAIIGAAIGGALSVLIGPAIQPLLFDNAARDPMLLSFVALGLLAVAVASSAWPAWRATRVDPLLALRSD
jgi:predicted permease